MTERRVTAANRAAEVVSSIREELAGRRIIWFGIRGEDGESLLQFPEFEASFSIIAALRSGVIPPESNVVYEALAGNRPDLDLYDLDFDATEPAQVFRSRMLRGVGTRCVVVTYRPSAFVSALAFSMNRSMILAGLFKDRQIAFEHKPWVETQLARRGVRALGWEYVANEHHVRVKRLLASEGSLVLRTSRASGGVGMVRVDSDADVDELWPAANEEFVGVAPFLRHSIPVNLSGCVFADGSVRLHPPSVQLIGIPSCTDRAFGYCGNDFGAIAALDAVVVDRLDQLGRTVGHWLHDERYIGAFGLDAMCAGSDVYFTEVNARFQGSSALSAEIAAGMGEPDLFTDHLAASLGLPASGEGLSLRDWLTSQPAAAHVVVHNTTGTDVRRRPAASMMFTRGVRIAQLLPPSVSADPGAAVCRAIFDRSVTTTGFELDAASVAVVDGLRRLLEAAAVESSAELRHVAAC